MGREPTAHSIPIGLNNIKTLYDLLSKAALTLHYYRDQDDTTRKVESDVTMACLWAAALFQDGKEYDLEEELRSIK